TAVARIAAAVGFAEKAESVHRVGRVAGPLAKGPAAFVANGIEDGHADGVFESEESPDDDRATGPGAGQGDIEMIPARSRSERGVAKRVLLALEITVFSGLPSNGTEVFFVHNREGG